MDNGMGGNGGSNGILMEDEILDTPAVSAPPKAAPQQTVQPQYGAASQQQAAGVQYGATASQAGQAATAQYGTGTQPNMQPQYSAASQQQAAGIQYGATAQQTVQQGQMVQPGQAAGTQYGTGAQPNRQSQYSAAAQPRQTAQSQYTATGAQQAASARPQQTQYGAKANDQQAAAMAAFNSAPSFDSMDGMNMSSNAMSSSEVFGSNTGSTSTGWENQNSDTAFRGSAAGRSMSDSVVIHEAASSNFFLGLIGAVIGALMGAVLWVIIYQMGYLAGIAGAAIIGFSIKGYAMLGRSLDVKGIILCAVLSIVTIYFAHRVSFAIVYMTTLNDNELFNMHISFKQAFMGVDKYLKEMDQLTELIGSGKSLTTAYYRDLFVGYALSAVVGIPMAIKMIGRY